MKRVLKCLAQSVFVFSFLAWLYVMIINFTHPEWLQWPLTHIAVFPLNLRTDTFGIGAFILAFSAFLTWMLLRS